MAYTVLARRYRSQGFEEVVGQEPIARTLQRAIATGRVAHAYLFVGTRGVGKTSMARIFAKALNAAEGLGEREKIAAAIMQGTDIDVVEIDAASNNSVENARDLIANSIYRPARCPYKIYIIDEVHMLSNAAFNALLKTMEEPPAHVKFILCTTEAHKVPATIQSRCQRFDFKAIPAARIAEHLRAVLKKEGVKAEDGVVYEVARQGHGSMRDALSLLDRLLASVSEGGTLDNDLLRDMLGIPDAALVAELSGAVATGQAAAALDKADNLLSKGLTLDQVLEALIGRFRDLLLAGTCGAESGLLERSGEERAEAARAAQAFAPEALVHMIVLLENVQRNLRTSAVPRALFDAALVRLCMLEHFAAPSALLKAEAGAQPAGGSAGGAESQKKNWVEHGRQARGGSDEQDAQQDVEAPHAEAAARRPTVEVRAMEPAAAATHANGTGPSHSALSPQEAFAKFLADANANRALASLAEKIEFVSADHHIVRLRLSDPVLRVYALSKCESMATGISKHLGRPVRVHLEADAGPGAAAPAAANHPAADAAALEEAMKHPLVRKALDLLDGKIVRIEPARAVNLGADTAPAPDVAALQPDDEEDAPAERASVLS